MGKTLPGRTAAKALDDLGLLVAGIVAIRGRHQQRVGASGKQIELGDEEIHIVYRVPPVPLVERSEGGVFQDCENRQNRFQMIVDSKKRKQPETQATPKIREQLEAEVGQAWDTRELARDFILIASSKPFVQVKRKSDGVVGNLTVQEHACIYWFEAI